MSLKKELKTTGLPEAIQRLIVRVVRRTRLRSREQHDIAMELIAHFEDALEKGEQPNDVITAYGNEKTAATLLRTSCKRKRWWVEVAFVKSMKCTAIVFACLIFVYLVMAIFTMQRIPNIAVDYVAMLNKTAAAIPEEERAWPLYRAAAIALSENSEPTPEIDGKPVSPIWVGDPGWDTYAQWLSLHVETLEFIREGAVKEGVGYLASHNIAEEDKALWPENYAKNQEQPDNTFLGMWFPQLGNMRDLVRVLKYDAIAAAEAGDGSRCVQDINSMLRLGTQTREHKTIINDLVSMSMYNLTFQTITEILWRTPEVIPLEKLRDMLRAIDDSLEVQFEGERMFILDLLQRVYTDDGHGDGVIVPQNLFEMMSDLSTPSVKPSILLAPLANILIASRKEMLEHYDQYIAHMEQYRDVPLYEWDEAVLEHGHKLEIRISDTYLNKYYFLDLLMPVLDRAMLTGKYAAARRDGLIATIYAMEVHRSTGAWPVELSGANVFDPWTGEPWRIAIVDEQPVIYSVGHNRIDDGGTHAKGSHKWSPNTANLTDGDWVIWPNPE